MVGFTPEIDVANDQTKQAMLFDVLVDLNFSSRP
tara:strand:+ start:118 stop:219 length:102 start_codon:yes stop_codon:yes gene_type:complete